MDVPSTLKNCSLTRTADRYSGSRPSMLELTLHGSAIAIASNDEGARVVQSMALAGATSSWLAPVSRLYCQIVITRSACGTDSGRISSASARLTIAVAAPMPTAKTSRAMAVKPGVLTSIRTP
jgi:hypothetical protein